MSDKLPKVSIAVVGVVIAQIGGFIWWTAQQASTIESLGEELEILSIQNNQADKTNLIRDVEENTERIDEIIDYIIEVEEDGEETIDELYEEIDALHEETASMAQHMMAIIKLQSRIAVIEKTMQYTQNDGM
jgi:hypothetical protein|tara:strand:- start:525 stop:920 length:396 start_codon:yes stop_codon:yes gene_type:complete